MKIAVNTRLLLANKLDGIGWFTFQTLKRITQSHPEHQFYFLFDRPYHPQFVFSDNIIPVVVSPPARHPLLWYIWFEYMVPKALRKIKPDIFLSPDGFVPLSLNIPVVTVIHDINFHHRPKDLPFSSRWYYTHFFPKFATKANGIATVSEYSKNDISKAYHIEPNKINVVYNGSHEFYKPITEKLKSSFKEKYSGGSDFFIFIGSLHPRKNIDGLLKGFDIFKQKSLSDFKLIIVGEKFFMNRSIEKVFKEMKFSQDVIFTGRKEPAELSNLLASAWALTFVPHFEGFGIPLLEAMYCDIPSVTSNVTSLPEVAGETAIYVNPGDTSSIANGLIQMANDDNLRGKLIINCREQRIKFSWDKTAESLWNTLEKNIY